MSEIIKNEEKYIVEQFDDIRILRYHVPAFKSLSLNDKLMVYYLSKAATAGQDILIDQNNIYNLRIKDVIIKILKFYSGDRETENFKKFELFSKKFLFANGMHHHYSMDKFILNVTISYFKTLLEDVGESNKLRELKKILFDADYMQKRVVLGGKGDLITSSANNYYVDINQSEVEEFYKDMEGKHPLNSTLVKEKNKLNEENELSEDSQTKEDNKLIEEVWKVGGKYSKYLEKVVFYLRKALPYAHSEHQKISMQFLLDYYRTGDPSLFDKYSIEWLKDNNSPIDFINGFIEVYGDALGYKGSWESVVEIVDTIACERTDILAKNALWFEKNSPVANKFKKSEVKGISAKVMQVAMLGGDCFPYTPIGINLPNAEWIRESHGSKSVTLDNITYSYHEASLNSGVLKEFAYDKEEIELCKKYGSKADDLHTDLHECLGHGSGKLLEGVSQDALKSYGSTIEEARADLFALYYLMDPKLVELGLISTLDVGKAEYSSYIRSGLMVQLTRIQKGKDLEESHMRNRQLIAAYVFDKGKKDSVIERIEKNGSTFFKINDFNKLRTLFADMLAEIQRIKSEGDYKAAKQMVEDYGVKVDYKLHSEVLDRYKKLNQAPYSGFINPVYKLVKEDNTIIDVEIEYPETTFLDSMIK